MPFSDIELKAVKPLPDAYPLQFLSLGDLIRAARIEKGMFQKDVAQIFGVTTSTIENWEIGRSIPRSKYILEIRKFVIELGLSHQILEIGIRLNKYREHSKLTQLAMAKKLNMSLNTYRGIEQGNLSVYPSTFEKVMGFLEERNSEALR